MIDNSQTTEQLIVQAFPMIKCDNPECKKGKFCRPTKDWAYKLFYKGRRMYFCSYSCMRVIEKKKEAEEAVKRNKKPPKVDLRKRRDKRGK